MVTKGRFRVCPDGGCGLGELEALTRNRVSNVIVWGSTSSFL